MTDNVFFAVDQTTGWYHVPEDVSGLKIAEFKRKIKPILADDGCEVPKGMLAHVYLSSAKGVPADEAKRTYYEWSGIETLAEVKNKLLQMWDLEPTASRNVFVQLAPLAAAPAGFAARECLWSNILERTWHACVLRLMADPKSVALACCDCHASHLSFSMCHLQLLEEALAQGPRPGAAELKLLRLTGQLSVC